jgi:hypothetical protein
MMSLLSNILNAIIGANTKAPDTGIYTENDNVDERNQSNSAVSSSEDEWGYASDPWMPSLDSRIDTDADTDAF